MKTVIKFQRPTTSIDPTDLGPVETWFRLDGEEIKARHDAIADAWIAFFRGLGAEVLTIKANQAQGDFSADDAYLIANAAWDDPEDEDESEDEDGQEEDYVDDDPGDDPSLANVTF